MKISLCQLGIVFENKEKTLEKAEKYIKEAAASGSDLIAFPEMTLTGFSMNIQKTKENGETKSLFSELAKKYGIAAAFGWVEDCGERAKNIYTVIDKNGAELAEYAKIHPFSYADEDKYFIGGSESCSFEFMGIKTGLAVCYDLRFPQIFTPENELMLIPANWPKKRAEHWSALLKARAIENQAYIAGINCVGSMDGQEYDGGSAVYDANGCETALLRGSEGLLSAYIDREDIKKAREAFPVSRDRRNDLYKKFL